MLAFIKCITNIIWCVDVFPSQCPHLTPGLASRRAGPGRSLDSDWPVLPGWPVWDWPPLPTLATEELSDYSRASLRCLPSPWPALGREGSSPARAWAQLFVIIPRAGGRAQPPKREENYYAKPHLRMRGKLI